MARFVRELAVWIVLGTMAAGGVYLVRQNRTLAKQNTALARRAVEPRPGLFVPELRVATLEGTTVVLGELGHRQVLFFFNHTCPYYRASVPGWKAIAERLGRDSATAVYGIALDSAHVAEAHAAEHGLRFPVISNPDPRLVGLYWVSGVPLVLAVHDGRMIYARLGALDSPAAIDSVVAAARTPPPKLTREDGR